ncbi:MAG: hydroxymethylpyrimidine/phosphomethylpyrimidine kinase [Opitutae bacterium]
MPPNIGVIGGTDSSGGSGLGADERTISDLGCTAFCAVSAITYQNQSSHIRIHAVPLVGFKSQLDTLAEQRLDAVKIGMLPDARAVEAVALFLDQINCDRVIMDPVKKTSNGHDLISADGWTSLVKELLPRVDLLTPNLEEVLSLLGQNHSAGLQPPELVEKCIELGAKAVLLKGGHLPGTDSVTDFFLSHDQEYKSFSYPRMKGGTGVRGTGCRLASAIACEWARPNELEKAVKRAGEYLQTYIKKILP